MKMRIAALAILLGCTSAAWAEAPATLTTLHSIAALTNAEANKGIPVAIEATATYRHAEVNTLFVQEGDEAIFVGAGSEFNVTPGDRILVRGKTAGSFHPIVVASSIAVLRHGALPKPMPATYDELVRFQHDCMLVTVRGIVRAADSQMFKEGSYVTLQLLTDGGYILVGVDKFPPGSLESLLDAEVEITGVVAGQFDGKMQMHGIRIYSPPQEPVKILQRASANPWTLPLTPMDQVIAGYHVIDRSQRIRVHGTITFYQPGSSVVLQDGAKSLWISTSTFDPFKIGDVVDATGFPESHNGFLALTRGEIKDSHVNAPVAPIPTTRIELAKSGHVIDLVSVEGQVVTAIRGGTQDEYHLIADGQMFTAIFKHPLLAATLPPMKQIPIGSRVRVVGICITENSNPFDGETAFDILMRSFDDIAVVERPSLVNTRNLLLALGLLLVVVFGAVGRGWALERKLRRQTAAMSARTETEAELERQRSRILEDINGVRPLDEILEEIAAMVSSTLQGAPCWCQTADGEMLGSRPRQPQSLRIVQAEIFSRSGPSMGTIYAALDPQTPPSARASEALQNGGRLATLAIETRKLYSDLRRRSEFDLLTDIPNRFAMEKFMNSQIEEALISGKILGLIYIDLDKFKPINDTYGHHTGDLYLQEVAARMSKQLLGGDMLARLGGDEFAALVNLHHHRADLDKIIARLESCFDEPFAVSGHLIRGEASIGFALYPEDGDTKDSLLSAADDAMYVVKNAKRQTAGAAAAEHALSA